MPIPNQKVIHPIDGGWTVSEGTDHGDDLSAMELGMIKHVSQNFPAGKTRLTVGKLHDEFDVQASLGLVLDPVMVAVPECGPALLEDVERR
jgi:hypothetical protein